MEKLHSTFFYNILIDREEDLLEIEWINESSNVAEDVSDEIIETIRQAISENKAKKLLVNMIKSQYLLSVSNYKWYQNTIFTKINDLNIKKVAYVVPENLYVHITFVAASDDSDKGNTTDQYFKEYKKAVGWLKS